MLPHLRLFCNCFSSSTHVRQGRPGTDGRLGMGLSHPVVLLESALYQTGPRRCSTVRPAPTLASYNAQATQTTTQQSAANERHWHEHDLAWQQQCARLRTARSCQALAVRKGTQRARLVTAGIPALALALVPYMPLRQPVTALPGETVCVHDDGGDINTCSLGPICTADSPRCRPDDHPRHDIIRRPCSPQRLGWLQCPRLLRRSVLEHKNRGQRERTYLLATPPRTYWRHTHVPTGDAPRTYWRHAHVPTGDAPRTYWRRKPD